LFHILDK